MKFFKPFDHPEIPIFPKKDQNIKDFGAIPDCDIKCTKAIADAINECSKNGGGRVIIPKGKWLTGAIHFKDNVNLHLEQGSLVVFSKDFNDYLTQQLYEIKEQLHTLHIKLFSLEKEISKNEVTQKSHTLYEK